MLRAVLAYYCTWNCLPFAHPCRDKLVRGSGGYAAVSDLDNDIHHLEVVLQLPLRLGDVPRIPDMLAERSEDDMHM